jgi:hypothetical protein
MPPDLDSLRDLIQQRQYLLSDHASKRGVERGISSGEIEQAVLSGEVIEDYPDDKYGPSCLILGATENDRILHVQLSYPPQVKVITLYEPSPQEWEADWKTRKQP